MPKPILLASMLAALSAFALSPAAAQTPLFSDNSELEIVVEGPVQTVVRRAERNTDPVDVTVRIAGEPQTFAARLEPRGISRRTGGICNFPPLRFDFGDDVRDTLLRGQNRIKIVTRCRGGAAYEQLTVLEYTAYRLYNEITPLSYRVRPARITYRDRNEQTQFNFLIEDVDDLARRNNRMVAIDVSPSEVNSAMLDPRAAMHYALFQFMIGNLDWDMVSARAGEDCCHNSRLIAANATARSGLIPAPYDFDYSGLVNAPYALAPESVPVRNVRQRYWRGYCRTNSELPAAIAHFQSRREALLAVIDGETRLTEGRRQGARQYIEEFFEIIGNPAQVQRQIVDRCRGPAA
jgi:hypothetical protein